jgi:hypothetical protein
MVEVGNDASLLGCLVEHQLKVGKPVDFSLEPCPGADEEVRPVVNVPLFQRSQVDEEPVLGQVVFSKHVGTSPLGPSHRVVVLGAMSSTLARGDDPAGSR